MSSTVFLDAGEFSVNEEDNFILVPVVRTGDLTGDVSVEFTVEDDDATVGVDYLDLQAGTTTITIPDGEDRAFFRFDMVSDTDVEGTETFITSITDVENSQALPTELGFPRTARVSILDDESPPPPPPDDPQSDFVVFEEFVTAVPAPVAFDWFPDQPNLMLIASKTGLVQVFDHNTNQIVSTFIDLQDEVNSFSDRGIMDIAIHPDFPNTPRIYITYTVDPPAPAGSPPPQPGDPDGPDGEGNRFNYLVSFEADLSGTAPVADLSSRQILLGGGGQTLADISGDGELDFAEQIHADKVASGYDPATDTYTRDYWKQDSNTHVGGGIAFGPDGALYVATGDGVSANYADPRAPAVQDLDSLNGKMLRIDPLTGDGLADNPFFDAADPGANASKVFQLGLRNPFRVAFDESGNLLISDTGWFSYEEINSGGAGANFGWPFYEGGDFGALETTPRYRDLAEATAFYQDVADGTIDVTAPFRAFSHADADPGFRMQAIVGGEEPYSGDVYPSVLQNDYFFTDVSSGKIYSVDVNDRTDVRLISQQNLGFGPVFIKEGPDEYLYYADLAGKQIGRWEIIAASDLPDVQMLEGPQFIFDTFTGGTGATGSGLAYPFFEDDGSVVVNGAASLNVGRLQLTQGVATVDSTLWERGSAFAAQTLEWEPGTSLSTRFTFTIDGGDGITGGDGVAFVLQADVDGPLALGLGGDELGYGGGTGAGIEPSVVIEFDTQQGPGDPDDNHIALHVGGDAATPLAVAQPAFDLNAGDEITAWIDYDGATDQLDVFVSTDGVKPDTATLSTTIVLESQLGTGPVQAGFSASASETANIHEVASWDLLARDEDQVGLRLNGGAAVAADRLRLTEAVADTAGSAYADTRLAVDADTSFHTAFGFEAGGGAGVGGGAGFAFILQRSPDGAAALGNPGGGGGYGGSGGISDSLVVEFDTSGNIWDPNFNHVAVHVGGDNRNALSVTASPAFDLNGGTPGYAWIDYDGATDQLDVFVNATDVKPLDPLLSTTVALTDHVGSGLAHLGFTAGTGGQPNRHDILDWQLASTDLQPPLAPTAIDVDGLTVAENTPGALLGTVTVTDADDAEHLLSVSDARFEIDDADRLKLVDGVSLDFETEVTVALDITAEDAAGNSFTAPFAVTVEDRPDGSGETLDLAGATLTANGGAAVLADGRLRLTEAVADTAGSAYADTRLAVDADTSFHTAFGFEAGGGAGVGGGAGFAFILQRSPDGAAALGNPGGGGGYGGSGGISDSLVVEFDTSGNIWDPNFNHVAVHVGGDNRNALSVTASPAFDLNGGTPGYAWIDYDGATDQLDVFVNATDVKPLDPLLSTTVALTDHVGSGLAHLGFTAGTGGQPNRHDILDWQLASTDLQPPLGTPIRIEAEAFTQFATGGTTFFTETSTPASNGELIRLPFDGTSASVSTALDAFGVTAGTYQVSVGYVDETDGTPQAALSLADVQVASWSYADGTFVDPDASRGTADQPGNFKTLTFGDAFTVAAGDELTFESAVDSGAAARFDYVEFTPLLGV